MATIAPLRERLLEATNWDPVMEGYNDLLQEAADEIEKLAVLLIEARNPGIDLDEVRRLRAEAAERNATCLHGRHFGGHYCEECH